MTAQRTKEVTIAVLPFQILAERDKMNPLILGFTEDLITNFSMFTGLSVISQYSTQHINDPGQTDDIARLGANYLVAGSFRIAGNRVRIGIQLIRTEDNNVVFARQYDETLTTLLGIEDTIIQQIVSVLQQQIDYDLLSYSYKKSTVQLAAYENWLRGMDCLKKGTLESDLKARHYFEAALEIDPHFARAYTGISLSYFNEWSCLLWDRWDVSQKGAHEYALKALEFDENDYISLAVLGRTFLFSEQYEKAEHYIRKAIRMNPNDPKNLILVAFSMVYLGYPEEAEKLYEKAMLLNPLHQDAYFAHGSLIYFELGQFEKSVELGKKVDLESTWVDFPAYMAAAFHHLSDPENRRVYWNKFLRQFQKKINGGIDPSDQDALNWHIKVNPYSGKTHLRTFWEYIGGPQPASAASQSGQRDVSPTEASFIRKGDLWELRFASQTALVKDAKGYHDLAKLLAEPEKAFHCTELMGGIPEDFKGPEALDQKAKTSIKKRIEELQTELAEAEDMYNSAMVASLREEYENLIDYLAQSLGLAGKSRQIGSTVEKARTAVTWRIRSAIKKIKQVHPTLAKHLSQSVKTGTFCSYRPEQLITWTV